MTTRTMTVYVTGDTAALDRALDRSAAKVAAFNAKVGTDAEKAAKAEADAQKKAQQAADAAARKAEQTAIAGFRRQVVDMDKVTASAARAGKEIERSFGQDVSKVMHGQLNTISSDLGRITTQTGQVGTVIGSILGGALRMGGVTAAVAGTATAFVAVASAMALSTAAAIPFDAEMHNVATLSDSVKANMAGAEQQILQLSNTVPQTATQLAKGLYNIESSNFHAADAMHVLDVSAKAASAGLSDTDTAARAITGALNAYGLSAASAGDVSDILFQTVNKGVVSFSDLAQNLGDFVSTAAAAKVPLQDVSAAYAAITLSGVPAAEAATAVNQVLTQLLKPSKNLAGLYKELGYRSGEAALQQKGLAGVIKDIGTATGGSAAQVVRLFQRVEASKGVLALLAAGGRNYQDSLDAIASAQGRAGATQKAFNEQMQSTKAELQLIRNEAVNTAIALGLKLLPPFNAFLQMAQRVGGDALPFIEAALHRVAPLFQQVFGIVGDLGHVLAELVKDAGPVVAAMAGIAGAAIIGPLTVLLQLLHSLTSFLSEHAGLVAAVAAVYGLKLLPSITQVTVFMNRMIVTPVVLFLNSILTGAGGAAGAIKSLGSAFSVSNVTMGAAVAAVALYVGNMQMASNAANKAQGEIDKLTGSMTQFNAATAKEQLSQLTAVINENLRAIKPYADSVAGYLKADALGVASLVGLDDQGNQLALQAELADKASQKYQELAGELKNYGQNVHQIAEITGATESTIGKIAALQNIDLSKPFEQSAGARKQLIDYLKDLKTEDSITAKAIVSNAHLDLDAMKELEDQVNKVVKAATTAFQNDTDVLGQFAENTKTAVKAQDALGKARAKASGTSTGTAGLTQLRDEQRIARDRQSIRDAEDRAATAHSKTASGVLSHEQSIARARQKLADDQALIAKRGSSVGTSGAVATADAKAKAASASADLAALYRKAVATSKQFVQDINTAIQRGLDPSVVTKLLVEGPTKAEPALQAILRDHSGNMIKMVNQSEQALANLSGFVAEQARIAALAMNAPTDQYTKDLKTAMAIAAQEASTGGKATAAALARSLRTSQKEVERIAGEFGITLGDAVQAAVNKRGPIRVTASGTMYVTQDRQGSLPSRRDRQVARAEGGPIDAGPFGRDAVFAGVTRGEWVQPVASVQHYGSAFMEAVRTRTFPKLWDGGLVGMDGAMISNVVSVSGPRIVPVPVPVASRSSYDNSVTYNIDKVVASSPWDLPNAGPRTYSASRGVT